MKYFILFIGLFIFSFQSHDPEIKVLGINQNACMSNAYRVSFQFLTDSVDTNLLIIEAQEGLPNVFLQNDTVSIKLTELTLAEKSFLTGMRRAPFALYCDNQFIFHSNTRVFKIANVD